MIVKTAAIFREEKRKKKNRFKETELFLIEWTIVLNRHGC